MTTLIILGNTNPFTFANSIIVANAKSKEIFHDQLTSVYVIHSTGSFDKLRGESDWAEHLRANGLSRELLIDRTIEITSEKDSIHRFVRYLESIVKGESEKSNLMIDLTNGTTLQKNLLSMVTYILDLHNQYLIDTVKLFKATKNKGFLPVDVLLPNYVPAPDGTHLDSIAYLNLSEMVRYKRVIDVHAKKYNGIDKESADVEFFKGNLRHSIQLKLQGDRSRDNAVYRIAAASISASVEDLISLLLDKLKSVVGSGKPDRQTFGQKLHAMQVKLEKYSKPELDLEFLRKFNDFILYLRNSSTHKGRLLTDVERFKADLSVKMSFPFIEFYTDIVYPVLSNGFSVEKPRKIRRLSDSDVQAGDVFYYGLDGDDTGSILEELFLSSSDENKFRRLSQSVTKAITDIGALIRARSGRKAIVFEAGDDLLFKGRFDEPALRAMQRTYQEVTTGLTCSVGYGKSFEEVYLALKMAKNQPRKNSIVGLEIG